ncbi:MAG: AtpZ/AtpI family protein [Candidatus Dormibacteria bacterium]
MVGVFSITVVTGVVAGVLLDRVFHTLPWLTLTGLALGLAGGSLALYRGLLVYRDPGI